MTEDRTPEIQDDEGPIHTHTTILREVPERQRGIGGVIVLLLVLAAIAAFGLVVFSQTSDAETAKDKAVAGATEKVGSAADQVGNAAGDGVDRITE